MQFVNLVGVHETAHQPSASFDQHIGKPPASELVQEFAQAAGVVRALADEDFASHIDQPLPVTR
jgi:hypothetical protein